MVYGTISDRYGSLDKDLREALDTKLKLHLKRSKLRWDTELYDLLTKGKRGTSVGLCWITVEVGAIKKSGGGVFAYTWRVYISRPVKTLDGKTTLPMAKWSLDGGYVPTAASLKENIDTELDKICLRMIDFPEAKTRREEILEALDSPSPPEKPKK